MTTNQTTRIKNAIAHYSVEWNDLDRVIREIEISGTASATLSTGDGSKSYTRLDLPVLSARQSYVGQCIAAARRRLDGVGGIGIRRIEITRY